MSKFIPHIFIAITPRGDEKLSVKLRGGDEAGKITEKIFTISPQVEAELNNIYTEQKKVSDDIFRHKFRDKKPGYKIFGLVTQEAYEKIIEVTSLKEISNAA